MRKKKFYLVATLAIMIITSVGILTPEKKVKASDANDYTVSFEKAKSLGEIMKQIKKSDTDLVALRDSFTTPLDGVTITDFYIIQPDKNTRRAIIKDYHAAREGMIADLNREAKAVQAKTLSTDPWQPKLPSFSPNDITDKIEVESVVLSGSKEQINKFSKSLGAKEIKLHKDKVITDTEVKSQKWVRSTAWVHPDTWVPKQGYLVTGTSTTVGEHFATNYMWWNDVSGFSGLSFQTAYEHEFLLDMSDGETYLDPSDTFVNRYPNITYGASTLPEPYLDTRFTDGYNELSYTIGSEEADLITAGGQYYDYNYLRTLPGVSDIDNAKVQVQFSEYVSGCFLAPAFCIFSVKGTPIVKVAPWDVPVPSTHFWHTW